jgi:hypothetical protein
MIDKARIAAILDLGEREATKVLNLSESIFLTFTPDKRDVAERAAKELCGWSCPVYHETLSDREPDAWGLGFSKDPDRHDYATDF